MPTPCVAQAQFDLLQAKPIVAEFDGGDLTSDAGMLLLAQADRAMGLIERLASCLIDRRQPGKIQFSILELLRQRIFALAAGYEDANDHNVLRADAALKVAAGRLPKSDPNLAGQSTLSRFENRITDRELIAMATTFVDFFIDLHRYQPPNQITLDFDATDDPTHGQQQFALFHGYYDTHCYVPLIATASCEGGPHQPILAILRPGDAHAAQGVPSLLRRLLIRLKDAMPATAIAFRADSGFAVAELYDVCEAQRISYGIGLATNSVLRRCAEPFRRQAYEQFYQTGETTQVFGDFLYQAESWPHPRRVIAKAEIIAGHHGDANLRFVVTNDMHRAPDQVYQLYVQRGDMESRIDELKNGCFSGRTSCHQFRANQFRLFMALAAYWLFVWLRQHLDSPEMRVAQVATLRTRLIQVAARVFQSVRRVKFSLPTAYPWRDVWIAAARAAGALT